jgi:hypothetical protein
MKVPWYDKHVIQLRDAALATDREDYCEWFVHIADLLEAHASVRNLDEVMLTAKLELLRAEKEIGDES